MNNQEGKARQQPHKCEAYGRQFWFSADLHQHQKQHSGEKFFRKNESRDSEKLQNLCDGEYLCTWWRQNAHASCLWPSALGPSWQNEAPTWALVVGDSLVLDRSLTNAVNVGKNSPGKTRLLDIRESTLERDLMSAANVGNASAKAVTFSNIRPYTQVKGLTSATNAGNFSDRSLTSLNTGEFTQEKGSFSSVTVENSLIANRTSFNTRRFTQEQGHTCAVNVGKSSTANTHWFCTRELTLEKIPMSAANVGRLQSKLPP